MANSALPLGDTGYASAVFELLLGTAFQAEGPERETDERMQAER